MIRVNFKPFCIQLKLGILAGRFSARTIPPFIFIRSPYWNDNALIQHEKQHIRQFYKNPIQSLTYHFNKERRYKMELEAYAVQVVAGGLKIDEASGFIYKNYQLGKPYKLIKLALTQEVKKIRG